MKASLISGVLFVAGAAILVAFTIRSAPVTGQTPPGAPLPARIDGKPNLTGLWQAMPDIHWDLRGHEARPGPSQFGALFSEPPSVGVVEGNEIPYLPAAAKQQQENFAERWARDPEAKCYMPGVPRATYMPYPFQIVQSTRKILIAYSYASASRLIPLEDVEDSPAEMWMGWSRGRWERDTLVVSVNSFNDQTWFDRAGNFHSDALEVVERYALADRNTIAYEATITDPKVFSRPWKISLPLYRRLEPNVQFLEFKCVPFAEELMYGHLRRQAN